MIDGREEKLSLWDIKDITKKHMIANHFNLINAHTYREKHKANGERVFYKCSCNQYANIEMAIVKGDSFHVRDLEAGLHKKDCPFFSIKSYHSENGSEMALTESMFKAPTDANNIDEEDISLLSDITCKTIIRVNTKRVNTFNGLIFSILDSINIDCTLKDYDTNYIARNFIARFSNLKVGVKGHDTFSDFQNKLEKKKKGLFLEIGYLKDNITVIKNIYSEKEKCYVNVCDTSNTPIKYQIEEFLLLTGKPKFTFKNEILFYKTKACKSTKIYPSFPVMKQTLNNIRNFNNITDGPYCVVSLQSYDIEDIDKEKPARKTNFKSVRLFFQPIYMAESSKLILPVESNFERQCIEYLDSKFKDIKLYKPLTLDKTLFFENLETFLEDYPQYFKNYKDECDKYDKFRVIRPDLFMLKEQKLYVFEFAGYVNDDKYMNRLKKKEQDFYHKLKDITYLPISLNKMEKDFSDNGL